MFNSINYDIFDKSESGMGGESEQEEDGDYFVGFENEEFEWDRDWGLILIFYIIEKIFLFYFSWSLNKISLFLFVMLF